MSNITVLNFIKLTFSVLLFPFAKAKFTNLLGHLHYVQLFINHRQALSNIFFLVFTGVTKTQR